MIDGRREFVGDLVALVRSDLAAVGGNRASPEKLHPFPDIPILRRRAAAKASVEVLRPYFEESR